MISRISKVEKKRAPNLKRKSTMRFRRYMKINFPHPVEKKQKQKNTTTRKTTRLFLTLLQCDDITAISSFFFFFFFSVTRAGRIFYYFVLLLLGFNGSTAREKEGENVVLESSCQHDDLTEDPTGMLNDDGQRG